VTILCTLVNVYIFIIFGRIILSWFPRSSGVLGTIGDVFFCLTETVLGPVRRMVPMIAMGGMGLDLSPIIVLLALQIVVKGLILHCGA
jgi:YggT family protein